MLQQTTVATVSTRFLQFIDLFPDIRSLAEADEQSVLKAWEGLGYYSRARNLLRSARIIVAEHSGTFPTKPDAVLALPGIGRYVMGAVLSQAFDQPMPIVEANTRRLLARLFARVGDLTTSENQAWLWDTAQKVLPKRRAGDFNQALMELGAIVCTIENPSCESCPLRTECAAFRENLQDKIPTRKQTRPPTSVREVCLMASHNGRILLAQRPAKGRWASMWEMPRTELVDNEDERTGAARLLGEMGIIATLGATLGSIRHVVTRFRIDLNCIACECQRPEVRLHYYGRYEWVKPSDLGNYPLSSPQRKLMTQLGVSSS